jgi:hypothetical protein
MRHHKHCLAKTEMKKMVVKAYEQDDMEALALGWRLEGELMRFISTGHEFSLGAQTHYLP